MVQEITTTLREWAAIWKQLYVVRAGGLGGRGAGGARGDPALLPAGRADGAVPAGEADDVRADGAALAAALRDAAQGRAPAAQEGGDRQDRLRQQVRAGGICSRPGHRCRGCSAPLLQCPRCPGCPCVPITPAGWPWGSPASLLSWLSPCPHHPGWLAPGQPCSPGCPRVPITPAGWPRGSPASPLSQLAVPGWLGTWPARALCLQPPSPCQPLSMQGQVGPSGMHGPTDQSGRWVPPDPIPASAGSLRWTWWCGTRTRTSWTPTGPASSASCRHTRRLRRKSRSASRRRW